MECGHSPAAGLHMSSIKRQKCDTDFNKHSCGRTITLKRLLFAEGKPDYSPVLYTLHFNKDHHKKQLCILTNDVFPLSYTLFFFFFPTFTSLFFLVFCLFLLSFILSFSFSVCPEFIAYLWVRYEWGELNVLVCDTLLWHAVSTTLLTHTTHTHTLCFSLLHHDRQPFSLWHAHILLQSSSSLSSLHHRCHYYAPTAH